METRLHLKNFRSDRSPLTGEKQRKLDVSKENRESAFEGRFKATKMWNGVMRRFRNGMPLKRHRKMMLPYDDSFSGREATDFLMNELPKFYSENKEITRLNCHMLLTKFMTAGLFLPVRGNSGEGRDIFKENELYRFSDVPVETVAATPILVRRAASFNERCSFDRVSSTRQNAKITRFHKLDSTRRFDDRMLPGISAIPTVRSPTLAKSRRLSSSHGNLPSMISPRMFDTVETVISTQTQFDYNVRESDEENFSEKEENVENEEDKNPLDEVILGLQKVGDTVPDMNATLSLRSFGKVVQPIVSEEESSPNLNEDKRENFVISRSRLFPVKLTKNCSSNSDIFRIWKETLLSRLSKILKVESLDDILEHVFLGHDVKWNCEKIGIKGIVRVKNENDDLSTYLIAMMRYLTRWPFDQKFVEKVVVYPGMEKNVFKNVCEHFAKGPQLLPNSVANAILQIVQLFKARNKRTSNSFLPIQKRIQAEGEFSSDSSPITRCVNMLRRGIERRSVTSPPASITSMSCSKGFTRGLKTRKSLMTIPSWGGSLTTESEERESKIEKDDPVVASSARMASTDDQKYDSVFARLPGLQRSPELLLRLEELAHTDAEKNEVTPMNRFQFSPSANNTPRLGLSPLVTNIAREDEAGLIESIALVLLTLAPSTRRRLHYVLRFMEKICKNHCLRLNANLENRYEVLQSSLCESVVAASESISFVQRFQLVTFLMDNQDELFTVPNGFRLEVEKNIGIHNDEKITSNKRAMVESVTDENPKRQYCEPIKPMEYEEQKEIGMERHLLSLLDSITGNENLTAEERKRQLKKFKRTYPPIYAKRFPSPKLRDMKPRTPSFLDRLRNLNFR